MALGSTQPLAEMSTRSISWRLKTAGVKFDELTTILCGCRVNWEPFWNTLDHSRPVTGLIYLLIFLQLQFLKAELGSEVEGTEKKTVQKQASC